MSERIPYAKVELLNWPDAAITVYRQEEEDRLHHEEALYDLLDLLTADSVGHVVRYCPPPIHDHLRDLVGGVVPNSRLYFTHGARESDGMKPDFVICAKEITFGQIREIIDELTSFDEIEDVQVSVTSHRSKKSNSRVRARFQYVLK